MDAFHRVSTDFGLLLCNCRAAVGRPFLRARTFCKAADVDTKPKQKNQQKQQQNKKGGGKGEVSGITPQGEDFSKWYLDVIRECELAGANLDKAE